MRDARDVIRQPVVSEKSYGLLEDNVYTFVVAMSASKPEIRDAVIDTLTTISGQKPIMILAKKSVANFKVREGAPSAFMVTMRGDHMWHFLDRLISLAIPRIKDFRGLKTNSFDEGGSYSMGLTEQAVWPEINMAEVKFNHGMNINIVFENSTAELSRFALEQLGMPFRKEEE